MRPQSSRQRNRQIDASVVDLFCGAGGLTHGFYLEGVRIAAGVDSDETCGYPYKENNKAPFICADVSRLKPAELAEAFGDSKFRILVGCAPCQPFSIYNQKNKDPSWRLLENFGDLIDQVHPDVVSMENVPQLVKFRGGGLFRNFVQRLQTADYSVNYGTLYGPDYGLPQTRSRLVLLASRLGPIALPQPTHTKSDYRTVEDAIGSLPPLEDGQVDPQDPMHRCSRLSPINLKRIRSSKPNSTWKDWPADLVAECHTRRTGKGYVSVYGRMQWDEPSPTITTQFYGFGNGRFGHPVQDRALSLREGAILQGFPPEYKFVEPGKRYEFKKLGRLIGNAVPVILAQAIAQTIKTHLITHSNTVDGPSILVEN